MKVLRISHSAVVASWRAREEALRATGATVRLLCARTWDVGGTPVGLAARPGEDVVGARTIGRHPALFLYTPRPLWRALGEGWDVLDLHEEPFALATAEVLALRALRRLTGRTVPPYVLYSAQNIPKRYPWPFRWFEARALRGASGVSVCNEGARHVLRGKGARCRIETVPLGVDTGVFHPGTSGAGRRPDGGFHAVVAGRLEPHKGVDVAVRAVLDDDTLTLMIAGAGSAEAELRALATPAGERIRFVGPLPAEDLAALYREADALVVPSRATPSWVEQFGRVAVEAMACGTPVVAAATGALPDVVGGAGLLVPPDDPAALRAALHRVRDEPGLAGRLRVTGLARARDCTWQAVADRYRELYAAALSQPGAPAARGPGRPAPEERPAREPAEVVLVAYGAPELVQAALEPLAGKHPVTVVDNSSLPAVRDIAERLGARYLDPGRNLGFAAGVNVALADRQAPDTDVLLLNPDAVVSPETVAALAGVLRAEPDVASVGPVQTDGEGAAARVSWPFPSPVRSWAEALGLARLVGPGRHGTFVIGSVLLLSRDALAEVGGLDERFFLYAEETDWAYRAARAGWRHVVAEEATALHLGGATSTDPTLRESIFHTSQERYFRKHFGPLGWTTARLAQVAGSAARALVLRDGRGAAARRRLRLYLRGPATTSDRVRTRQDEGA
ncbi:glycosyltransferase [Isoptericola rhizosphaerae]|uniref:glycosyltransferase n=1 Tax=Isoptericola rhizosphaerae TaxID=3377837 RepID=UPI003839E8AB